MARQGHSYVVPTLNTETRPIPGPLVGYASRHDRPESRVSRDELGRRHKPARGAVAYAIRRAHVRASRAGVIARTTHLRLCHLCHPPSRDYYYYYFQI